MKYVKPEIEIQKFKWEGIYTTDHIHVSGTTTGSGEEPDWSDVGGDDWWQN